LPAGLALVSIVNRALLLRGEAPLARNSRPFPDFLEPAFDAGSLDALESTVVVVDPSGQILWVNHAWDRFARENGGGELTGRGSYLDAISAPLREFYRAVFDKALASGEVFDQDYECSSPDKRRVYHFRVLPIARRGLLLEHSLVASTDHTWPVAEALESRYVGANGRILQCSHCARVRAIETQSWDWVPAWVAQKDPRSSHVICPSCVGFHWGARAGRLRGDKTR
jgi:hypothetical protein